MSILDEVLLRREENRRVQPPNVYYLYNLVGPCLRDTVLGLFLNKPHDIETLRIFEAGNELQAWWRDTLKEAGHHILLEEQRIRHKTKKYSIHGRYDLITQLDYGPFILREIKTMKSAGWLREAKEDHVAQNQFYLNKTGIEFGSIDVIDKMAFATGERQIDYSFPTKKDPAIFCDLLNTAEDLHPYAEIVWDLIGRGVKDVARLEGLLPPPTPCWKCNRQNRSRKIYCDHYEECQKLGEDNDE